jgi:hypothetical protein
LAPFANSGEMAALALLKVRFVAVAPATQKTARTTIFLPVTAATTEEAVWDAAMLAMALNGVRLLSLSFTFI